jgi:hypothetical protein
VTLPEFFRGLRDQWGLHFTGREVSALARCLDTCLLVDVDLEMLM